MHVALTFAIALSLAPPGGANPYRLLHGVPSHAARAVRFFRPVGVDLIVRRIGAG